MACNYTLVYIGPSNAEAKTFLNRRGTVKSIFQNNQGAVCFLFSS
jgi:hypothetical protein